MRFFCAESLRMENFYGKRKTAFYNEYEEFYEMTKNSIAFKKFCVDAFGQDFSQDGFSDITQITSFDIVVSMDTMYFSKDMSAFAGQIKRWLKPDGILFAGYSEGELVPRTFDGYTTELAKALKNNRMNLCCSASFILFSFNPFQQPYPRVLRIPALPPLWRVHRHSW